MADLPAAYQRHLTALTVADPEILREVWEEDGVLEFPYGPSVDLPQRLEGLERIVDYFSSGLAKFEGWTFGNAAYWRVENSDAFVVEMHGSCTIRASGTPYEQDYIVRFGLSPAGRIAWMREFWDPTKLEHQHQSSPPDCSRR